MLDAIDGCSLEGPHAAPAIAKPKMGQICLNEIIRARRVHATCRVMATEFANKWRERSLVEEARPGRAHAFAQRLGARPLPAVSLMVGWTQTSPPGRAEEHASTARVRGRANWLAAPRDEDLSGGSLELFELLLDCHLFVGRQALEQALEL